MTLSRGWTTGSRPWIGLLQGPRLELHGRGICSRRRRERSRSSQVLVLMGQRLSGVSLGPREATAPVKFFQHPVRPPHSAGRPRAPGPCTCPPHTRVSAVVWLPGPVIHCDLLPTLDPDRHSIRTGSIPQGPLLLAPGSNYYILVCALLVRVCSCVTQWKPPEMTRGTYLHSVVGRTCRRVCCNTT